MTTAVQHLGAALVSVAIEAAQTRDRATRRAVASAHFRATRRTVISGKHMLSVRISEVGP